MKDMIPVLNLILSHWAADSEIVGVLRFTNLTINIIFNF